jgi:hypothetical protein
MPSWKIHVLSGVLAVGTLIGTYHILGWSRFYVLDSLRVGICAAFACVLGSDIADFDSRRTRIKHALGVILGLFVSAFYLLHIHIDVRPLWEAAWDWHAFYSSYFLIAFGLLVLCVLANTLVWFFPQRHRGRAHSLIAAGIYGSMWVPLGVFLFGFTLMDSLVVAGVGLMGYFLHLLLDLDLKVWR